MDNYTITSGNGQHMHQKFSGLLLRITFIILSFLLIANAVMLSKKGY